MSPERPRAAVTGAGGYVGGRIAEHLRGNGYRVLELRHRAGTASPDGDVRGYRLEDDPVEPGLLDGVELLVHAAHDFGPVRRSEIVRVNLDGSVRLFDAAVAAGVARIVFVSTISSFPGTRSHYGRVKLATENEARRRGAVVVRPGLVFGPPQGGMLAALDRLVARSPVLPLIGSGRWPQYLVHHEDLCRVMLAAAERGVSVPVTAAHPAAIPFREILTGLAAARGRRVRFVPVPWRLVRAGLALTESAGLRLGLRSDSVVGLVHQNPRPDFGALRELGIPLRAFDATAIR